MYNNKSKAFTLVELIVVIVILAILATIAFLSFSSQSASARDSTRLSDMNNIAKGLSVFNATAGKLPMPDNKIDITASGANIAFQGYAGSSVLGMIKISNGGKDPLDTTTYYTYSTNASQNKFQILGFLEDGNSSALSLSPDFTKSGLKDVFADPASYTGRYIITKGDQLGILLSSGSLVPAQAAGSNVDVVSTTKEFKVQFNSKDSISGSGAALKSMNAGGSLAYGLVGYWPFDEGSGNKTTATVSDNSNKQTNLDNTYFVFTGGKNGYGIEFTSSSATGVIIDTGFGNEKFKNGTTISFFTKTNKGFNPLTANDFWIHYTDLTNYCTQTRGIGYNLNKENLTTVALSGDQAFYRHWMEACPFKVNLYDNVYHLHTYTIDNNYYNVYIDGKLIYRKKILDTQSFFMLKNLKYYSGATLTNLYNNYSYAGGSAGNNSTALSDQYVSNYGKNIINLASVDYNIISIGAVSPGLILDELRIFNRVLTDSEVSELYNMTR